MATAPQQNETKPEMEKFFDEGMAFIATTRKATGKDPCSAIKPGTDEWDQWAAYLLARCGRLPRVMQRVLSGEFQSFTVPAQLPEWFDLKWVPPLSVPKSKPWRRYEPTDEERASNVIKLERYSRELGHSISMRKASERKRRQAPDPAAHLRAPPPAPSLEPSPELLKRLGEQRKAADDAGEGGDVA